MYSTHYYELTNKCPPTRVNAISGLISVLQQGIQSDLSYKSLLLIIGEYQLVDRPTEIWSVRSGEAITCPDWVVKGERPPVCLDC